MSERILFIAVVMTCGGLGSSVAYMLDKNLNTWGLIGSIFGFMLFKIFRQIR